LLDEVDDSYFYGTVLNAGNYTIKYYLKNNSIFGIHFYGYPSSNTIKELSTVMINLSFPNTITSIDNNIWPFNTSGSINLPPNLTYIKTWCFSCEDFYPLTQDQISYILSIN